jgi:hypothetical protein
LKNVQKNTKVKIVKVASAEDSDRYLEFEQRLAMAGQTMQGLITQDGQINMILVDTYIKFFTFVIPIEEMVKFLNSLKSKSDIKSVPTGVKLSGIMKNGIKEEV